MKIKSFSEAKAHLKELSDGIEAIREFLELADNAISAVDMLKGVSKSTPIRQDVRVPSSWADRVIAVFKQSNRPLMQKDAVDAYEVTGWPKPNNRKDLYQAISGAISYLHKKRGILNKTEEGYTLKE
jgi:hypothetical protein